jgi:polysaccharide biosynthesis protein PslG
VVGKNNYFIWNCKDSHTQKTPILHPDKINYPSYNIRMNKRTLIIISSIILISGVLLALDLRFQGLAWQFFFYQTGETTPVAQLRGMVEVTGNLIRPQPNTDPLTPIHHRTLSPYGMNVFLQKEVEEPKIRAMLEMIQTAGFTWLRQEFPWEDLEVDGRGQFTDTRNDTNGDGTPDTIDAWIKYDRLVALTEEYNFNLMVRLSNPPDWAISETPNIGTFAPPNDIQDYVNYAVAVAERYKGRIFYYQIWNEPNIYPEWGEQFADPIGYTELLCRTYNALKTVDPNIVVVSAAIAPTISLDGYLGYQDLVYLQTMYDNGAGGCFDVLAAQGYGLFSGAYDRRLRPTSVTLARHTYYREMMINNGDADKPIWISEAAWNAVEDANLAPDQIADYDRFGISNQQEAALNMPLMYQRAQEEWSWVGGIAYWFFTRPDPSEQGQSFYYFRMVEPDYQPDRPTFTPLPVYTSMLNYITTQTPTLYRGTYQAETWQATFEGELVDEAPAQFGQALQTQRYTVTLYATDASLRLKFDGTLNLTLNGQTQTLTGNGLWQTLPLLNTLIPTSATLILEANTPFQVDSLLVDNATWRKLSVPMLLVFLGIIGTLAIVITGLRQRFSA